MSDLMTNSLNYKLAINKYKKNSLQNRQKDDEKELKIRNNEDTKNIKSEEKEEKTKGIFTKQDQVEISVAYKANFLKKVLGTGENEVKKSIFAQVYTDDEFAALHNDKLEEYLRTTTDKDLDKLLKKAETNEEKRDIIEEYYTPENTSQRIFDFAISKFDLWSKKSEYKHKPDDIKLERFYDLMKGAIAGGFSEARQFIGKMPDEIDEVVTSTYDLTMEKFDSWFEDKKEEIEKNNQDGLEKVDEIKDENSENLDKERIE